MALSKILPASRDQSVDAANLILNGAMTVAQRGASFSSVTSTAYHLDRFQTLLNGLGTWTISQSTTAPTGFSNSLKYECTTADASPAAGDYLALYQKLEGQNLQHLKKGTANAESVTLSFWVRSNKTGTYNANLNDNDNNRLIGGTYSISSADTWEYKTITYSGDTTGVFDSDNGTSLIVEWWLGSGTSFSSGTTPSSWGTFLHANRNASGTVNLADTIGNTFYITGVCLNVGDQAPANYPHRSYGEELALCQRYFIRFANTTANPGTDNSHISMGLLYGGRFYGVMQLPKEMRTYPSGSSTSSGFSVFDPDGGSATGLSIDEFFAPSSHTVRLRTGIDAALQADSPAWVAMDTASAVLDFDAEL